MGLAWATNDVAAVSEVDNLAIPYNS